MLRQSIYMIRLFFRLWLWLWRPGLSLAASRDGFSRLGEPSTWTDQAAIYLRSHGRLDTNRIIREPIICSPLFRPIDWPRT